MVAVRLPKELEQRLERLAQKTHRTRSFYIRKALEQFLGEKEDYFLAIARLEEKNPGISLEEAIKQLGLED
jgi:RHH-type transcriptional regulator, rel operon repressor / antitoxin RelB